MRTTRASSLVAIVVLAGTASADVIAEDVDPPDTRPPSEVKPVVRGVRLGVREDVAPLWGGGVRMTGISGIGALPGRNYGGELALHLRHDELFGELALGRLRPEKDYVMVNEAAPSRRTPLGLDTWTARPGWASRTKPLRAWGLAEVGELANPGGMFSGVARMVTMQMPAERRWVALGAGFGVAWPFSSHGRLVGSFEVAVPMDRSPLMLAGGEFQPDPAAARTSLGLEVGWK